MYEIRVYFSSPMSAIMRELRWPLDCVCDILCLLTYIDIIFWVTNGIKRKRRLEENINQPYINFLCRSRSFFIAINLNCPNFAIFFGVFLAHSLCIFRNFFRIDEQLFSNRWCDLLANKYVSCPCSHV
jgi:hypothetical protein